MCLPVTPFKIEREWEHAGLKCAVVMAREAGHRCGYVRVPPSHPLHGKDYETPNVEVHGGLTFAEQEPCAHDDGQGWWFGFDCAHCMDLTTDPGADFSTLSKDAQRRADIDRQFPTEGIYRSQSYVERETESLAEQLAT